MHRIAAYAFAFAMAIPRCQWQHRCVVTLGKFLVVLYSEPLWRKGKRKQRRKGDVRDVKHYHGRCCKTGKGITAMTLQKKRGYELRCEKLRCASLRSALQRCGALRVRFCCLVGRDPGATRNWDPTSQEAKAEQIPSKQLPIGGPRCYQAHLCV